MTALRIIAPHEDPIVTMAREIVRGGRPNLTDADRTKLLMALLHGDLGGSEAWADSIWPVEKAFVEAYPHIVRSQETEA